MAIKRSGFDYDILSGTTGSDTLIADDDSFVTLDGGAGSDTYYIGDRTQRFDNIAPSDSVTIIENANGGTDKVVVDGEWSDFDGILLGDNIENLTLLGYADYGYGNDLNNIIDASLAYDSFYGDVFIYGQGGNDTITGSKYNDSLFGGMGNDVIKGGKGDDSIYGDDGNDNLNGGYGNDYFYGGYGNDVINGGDTKAFASVDDDYGYGGNDKMYGQYGNDTLNGGNDTIIADSYGASLYAGSDRLYGGWGNDTLNAGNDVLTGDIASYADVYYGGQDMLFGDYGNDTLNGGNHTITGSNWALDSEVFYGFRGDYYGGYGNDIINMANITINGNDGYDVIYGGYAYAAGDTFEASVYGGNDTVKGGNTVIHGNGGDDNISTIAAYDFLSERNTLMGGGGNDTITGGKFSVFGDSGNDLIYGGMLVYYGDSDAGADDLYAGDGNDRITGATQLLDGGTGDDYIYAGYEMFYGGGGNDIMTGGTTTINGGDGDDRVYLNGTAFQSFFGGYGNDTITAGNLNINLGAGDNFIYGQYGSDRAYGGAGYTILYGNYGNDTLNGAKGNDFINGGYGNDKLNGNAGNDFLFGGYGNDTITGGAGNDILWGGYGQGIFVDNDKLTGGAGNDIYYVGLGYGNDTVVESSTAVGDDTVFVYGMSFTAGAGVENVIAWDTSVDVTLTGNSGNNYLYGGSGDDVLKGLGGSDSLNGGSGDDRMEGGAGNDNYIVDSFGDQVIESSGAGTDTVLVQFYGYGTLDANIENMTLGYGAGATTIIGTSANNVLRGNDYGNLIYGGAGNDTLTSGGGDDELFGGKGNDTYFVEGGNDSVFELAGEGTDTVRSNGDFTLGLNVENLVLIRGYYGYGYADYGFTGYGNALNNRIEGTAGSDVLFGGAGNDTLVGGAGNDIYWVDSLTDVITESANAGTDDWMYADTTLLSGTFTLKANVENGWLLGTGKLNLTGNSADNELWGNNDDNTLTAQGGNDTLYGSGGNDKLLGGDGSDYLDGGANADRMEGGLGNDTYYADRGDGAGTQITTNEDVVVDSGGALDQVFTTTYTYTLGSGIENLTLIDNGSSSSAHIGIGNSANNVIVGNSIRNVLDGQGGNDTLFGGAGDDTLMGGAGNDKLYGDGGSDELLGGTGNDIYFILDDGNLQNGVSSEGGTATEAASAGTDKVVFEGDRFNYDGHTLGDNVENLTLLGYTNYGYGNALNNIIDASAVYGDTWIYGDIVLYGDAGTDTLIGNNYDNRLYGGAGADTLKGGGGEDQLYGQAGNDRMEGGVGNDTYWVDSAGDVIVEGVNTNYGEDVAIVRFDTSLTLTMAANLEDMYVFYGSGGATGYTHYGDEGHDITGNTLDNVIYGDYGDNTISGGAGNDMIVGATNSWGYGDGVDILNGNDGNDVLYGAYGNDTLNGGAGNDSLYGGHGLDKMTGGSGDDRYVVDVGDGAGTVVASTAEDTVTESSGGGTDTVAFSRNSSDLDYTLQANVENLHVMGNTNNTTSVGNTLANTFIVDQLVDLDSFDGGTGNDTLDASGSLVYTSGEDGVVTLLNIENVLLSINLQNDADWSIDMGSVAGQTVTISGNTNTSSSLSLTNIDEVNHTIILQDFQGNTTDELSFSLTTDVGADDVLNFELNGSAPDSDSGDVTSAHIVSAGLVEHLEFLVRGDFNEIFVGGVANEEDFTFTGSGRRLDVEDLDDGATVILDDFTVQDLNLFVAPGADTVGNVLNLTLDNVVIGDEDSSNGLDTDNGAFDIETVNMLVQGTVASFVDGSNLYSSGTIMLTGAQDITFRDLNGSLNAIGYTGDLTVVNAGTVAAFIAGTGNDNVTFGTGATKLVFGANLNNSDTVDGGTGTDSLEAEFAAGTFQLHLVDIENMDFTLTGTGGEFVFNLGEIHDFGGNVDIDLTGANTTANVTFFVPSHDFGLFVGDYAIDGSFLTTGKLTAILGRDDDSVSGGGGDDFIYGDAGGDSMSGNGGADTLEGGEDDDSLFGDAGTDTLIGGLGLDFLYGGDDNDIYIIRAANEHTGAEIDEFASVSTGDEIRFTSTAGETLTLFGGDVDIEIVKISDAAGATTGTTAESINASAVGNLLTIIGNDGDNGLIGTGFADIIDGGGGDDTITGGAGVDDIDGGAGTADAVSESRDADFTLTDTTLIVGAEGTDTLANVEVANLTSTFFNRTFTVSGWTGGGSLNGFGIFGGDVVAATKDEDFTLANDLLESTDGMSMALAGIEIANLTGGAADNTFTVDGWTQSGTMDGAGGTGDTIVATNDTDFTLADGSLARSGFTTLTLMNIEKATLTGGDGDNDFTVTGWTTATNSATLDGGLGTDTVIDSNDVTTVTLTDTSLARTGLAAVTLANIEDAILTGGAAANTFDVSAFTLGTVTMTGGAGIDTFTGSATRTTDIVVETFAVATITLTDTSLNDGATTDVLANIDVANLTGDGAANTFNVDGWTGAGTMFGLAGADVIAATKDADFTLTNSSLDSSDGMTLILSSISVANLTGGAADNTFTVDGWTLTGTMDGGAGTADTINKTVDANFTVTDTSLATGDGMSLTLANIEVWNLTGGGSNNQFDVTNFGTVATNVANLDGGSPDDTDDVDTLVASNDVATMTLTDTSLTRATLGIVNLLGIEAASLTGGAAANTFDVSAFTLGTVTMVGGAGIDTFTGSATRTTDIVVETLAAAAITLTDTSLSDGTTTDVLSNIDVLNITGDGTDNAFTVSGWTGTGTLDGLGDATDDIILASKDADFILTNSSLDSSDGMSLSLLNIELATLTNSGTGGHSFTVTGRTTLAATLNGGAATDDTVIATNDVATITLTDATLARTGLATMALVGIEQATLTGGAGANTITAAAFTLGAVSLNGAGGTDTLTGGSGADTVNGGLANDILTGGAGNDSFVFDTLLGGNTDTIADFADAGATNTDEIVLDQTIFVLLTSLGDLSTSAFQSGAGLTEASVTGAVIIYDTSTGALYYDSNGTTGGGATQFATITGDPDALDASDFTVVG